MLPIIRLWLGLFQAMNIRHIIISQMCIRDRIMVEYAETHNLSISQLIRMGVELQMKQQANQ